MELRSCTNSRSLYALAEGDNRTYQGRNLPALVETSLYPSEWDAVDAVESYQGKK